MRKNILLILFAIHASLLGTRGTTCKDQTYFSTENQKPICSFAPAFVTLSWAFGSGLLEFTGLSAGIAGLGQLISFKLKQNKESRNDIGKYELNFGTPDPNQDDDKKDKTKIFEKNAKHMFRKNAENHISDTPANRKLLIDLTSDVTNFLGNDKYGNKWFAKILSDGKQLWASVRDNEIRNGGINSIIKYFNPETGLQALGKK